LARRRRTPGGQCTVVATASGCRTSRVRTAGIDRFCSFWRGDLTTLQRPPVVNISGNFAVPCGLPRASSDFPADLESQARGTSATTRATGCHAQRRVPFLSTVAVATSFVRSHRRANHASRPGGLGSTVGPTALLPKARLRRSRRSDRGHVA
jgi:hypothetical protein